MPGATDKKYDVICDCRKPKSGMILQAMHDFCVTPAETFLVGDSVRDIEAGQNVGVKGYLFQSGSLLFFMKKILDNNVSK